MRWDLIPVGTCPFKPTVLGANKWAMRIGNDESGRACSAILLELHIRSRRRSYLGCPEARAMRREAESGRTAEGREECESAHLKIVRRLPI